MYKNLHINDPLSITHFVMDQKNNLFSKIKQISIAPHPINILYQRHEAQVITRKNDFLVYILSFLTDITVNTNVLTPGHIFKFSEPFAGNCDKKI